MIAAFYFPKIQLNLHSSNFSNNVTNTSIFQYTFSISGNNGLEVYLDKKVATALTETHTQRDITSTKHMLDIMSDNMEHGDQLKRRGKSDTNKCQRCDIKDTTEHALFCPGLEDDCGVQSAATHLEALVLPRLTHSLADKYKSDLTTKLSIILHAVDYIQHTPDPISTQVADVERLTDLAELTTKVKRDINRAQRKLITQLTYRWECNGANHSRRQVGRQWTRAEADQVCAGEHEAGPDLQGPRASNPKPDQGKNNGNRSLTGGACPSRETCTKLVTKNNTKAKSNNKFSFKVRDMNKTELEMVDCAKKRKFDRENRLCDYLNMDSQHIMSGLNVENLCITASVITDRGRETIFRDGHRCVVEKEAGLNQYVNLSAVKSDILINLHSILAMATNHHESMKMLRGSPAVLMTQSTINSLFKMERTSFRTKWMREMKTMTPEDVWPVHIDDSKTPLWFLYSSQASRELRGLITHQDDLVKDIFLYDSKVVL